MTAARHDATLPELLAARARAASDGRLALDAAVGLLAAGTALVWRPTGWFFLAGAALCFAAFGLWGIADRELAERPAGNGRLIPRALVVLRGLAAVVGGLAALALLGALLAVGLGTWIS